ncbi:tRNA (adenosine(37)-N6)-threonylcarbamoyltransferase complex ATPase subunit type 1 TsaE [uncultured Lamprocystis sp.]|jgi:tRNA threonylcarbamoyladenosine biosynthesis protein TsaE|uniref:tRNA (adenosine(37)-N6)-threonylcarbamoyltransferase complex ATPase subunit type 1 TsaE n=1 Tax=uncultured Lamprocystis sp. TaxID=543132 RepID=UPI0025EB5837|nr:tRNA (adenosine(37)-N6)-threonylcarbamoyltransferase complex ATPase subunit type 1 TsaE [uncultured Lamprocystis sp.]
MNTDDDHGSIEVRLSDAESQTAFGADLAAHLPERLVIYLRGDLGTGKTTLARGILRGLGHRGAARSPTYTLIEPYEIGTTRVFHLDLYRLADPEELEYLGLRDLLAEAALWLVEWPERGAGLLPPPDLTIAIDSLDEGRRLTLTAHGEAASSVIEALRSGTGIH